MARGTLPKSKRKAQKVYEDGSVGGPFEKHKIGPWMPKSKGKVTGKRPAPAVRKQRKPKVGAV